VSESTVSLNPAGRVFLNYASQDVALVQQVCAALEASGQRCWIAPRDVHAGESYAAAIVEAINSCRMLLLLLSSHSIAGQQAEAQKYAALAIDLGWLKDEGALLGMAIRTALLENRLADVPRLIESTSRDYADPDFARQVAAFKRIYLALADPAQLAAAIAMRTSLYPRRPVVGLGDMTICSIAVTGYVVTGAPDAAFDLSNKCRDQTLATSRAGVLQVSKIFGPEMRTFRRDPRFPAYAARFSDAMAYWQKYGPPDDCDLAGGKLTCH
jgi:hypothetical protein